MGISATLSLDESLGMANTTPVKDALGINVKGAVKSTICAYYTKRQIGLDDKTYSSFRDELIPIIGSLDPKRPIVVTGHSMGAAISPLVVADIYDALKAHKLNLSLINFAAYKSADAELCQQILDWGTDAASYKIQDDPVTNMTGQFSFLKGFGESLWIPMILSYKKEIEAERLKSKTKVCSLCHSKGINKFLTILAVFRILAINTSITAFLKAPHKTRLALLFME